MANDLVLAQHIHSGQVYQLVAGEIEAPGLAPDGARLVLEDVDGNTLVVTKAARYYRAFPPLDPGNLTSGEISWLVDQTVKYLESKDPVTLALLAEVAREVPLHDGRPWHAFQVGTYVHLKTTWRKEAAKPKEVRDCLMLEFLQDWLVGKDITKVFDAVQDAYRYADEQLAKRLRSDLADLTPAQRWAKMQQEFYLY